jgi:cysteine desulfurase/selenocysteine lyase
LFSIIKINYTESLRISNINEVIAMNVEKIRADFPILQQKIKGKPIIYFDNACVTLKPRQVIDAMNEYYENYPACADRSIHKLSNKVDEEYHKAREKIAKFIGAKKTEEIIFTRNTTEGMNLIANSFWFEKGDVILTTDREHNSALVPWQVAAKRFGIEHRIVFSKEDSTFDLEKFKQMVKNVKLVSMVHSSNLDGYTIPAKEIIKIAHDAGALVLLDAAQSIPHKDLDVRKLDVDFIAFSGHKMLGPSGTGALYGKYDLLEKLNPFLTGGHMVANTTYSSFDLMKPPDKFEAGLQNYGGAIGFGAAVDYLKAVGKEKIEKHEIELNKIITDGIKGIGGLEILGPQQPELRGGIISFVIDGIHPHDIALILDDTANIAIRSGAHCMHSWFNAHNLPNGSARASLYLYNTKEEAEIFINKLNELVKSLR